jgi:hypothetical protein
LCLFRAGCLLRTRRLHGPFGATRSGIAAVFPARASVAPRVPRSVSPYIAIPVTVSAVAISIAVAAAAAATIAVVTRVAMCRPIAHGR